VVIAVLLAAMMVVVLFTLVFPWLEPRLPFGSVTVDDGALGATWPPSGRMTA
jgi:hypothetical protein